MKFILSNKEKIKLVETLLLVSGFLIALKLPQNIIPTFILFVISSLLYIITLPHTSQLEKIFNEKKSRFTFPIWHLFVTVGVSASFSGMLVALASMGMPGTGILGIVYCIVLYVLFTCLLTIVLFSANIEKSDNTNNKQVKIDSKKWEEDPAFVKIK